MPLPSVTIDIVGQNYKKGAEVNIKIEPLPAHLIHLAEKKHSFFIFKETQGYERGVSRSAHP